ncbi:MAG: ferritin-like domain-containing protein [Myxococcota bacterium]
MTRRNPLAVLAGACVKPLQRKTRLTDLGGLGQARLGREARIARSLERVYHTGQDRIWDGKTVLAELVAKHGGVNVEEPYRSSLHAVLSAMVWGELAAWKVSSALAASLDFHEGRLAATSQAHDEARHFFVLYDYLQLLGGEPTLAPKPARRVLEKVIDADSLAKKLVGMQLLVEPVALTLFTVMRRSEVCPVLSELLPYLEQDEARHVNVGTHLLPSLIREMGAVEALDYWAYQGRLFQLEIAGLQQLEPHIAVLGCEIRDVFRLGMGKQLGAARMVTDQLGSRSQVAIDVLRRSMEFTQAWRFPEGGTEAGWFDRLRSGAKAAGTRAMPMEMVSS